MFKKMITWVDFNGKISVIYNRVFKLYEI